MGIEVSRFRITIEVEVPKGDDEGDYKEEFRRELAKRTLNIILNREIEPARKAVEEILRGKESEEKNLT